MGIFEDYVKQAASDCANARGPEPEPYFPRKGCHDCGRETTGADLWCDACHEKLVRPRRGGSCARCQALTAAPDVTECRDCYERRERREAGNDAGIGEV